MQVKKVIDQWQTYVMRSSASLATNPLNDNEKAGHIGFIVICMYIYIYIYIIYVNIYIFIYLNLYMLYIYAIYVHVYI